MMTPTMSNNEFGQILAESLDGIATVKPHTRIQNYSVDFFLPECGLVVEYDEEPADSFDYPKINGDRDRFLNCLGYTVIKLNRREPIGKALNRILVPAFKSRK
jgi:very-short-patch-repair endonuclease